MKRVSPKLILLSILVLFFLPLALAWMLFTGVIPFNSGSTRNLGTLVVPAVPLDWSRMTIIKGDVSQPSLHGRWVITYVVPEPCEKECLELAAGLRQVHLALGHNSSRVNIALLMNASGSIARDDQLLRIYREFKLVADPYAEFSAAIRQARKNDPDPAISPDVYLVDPDGNIMMSYNGAGSPNKLIKDLDRRLTWSKQDNRS